MSHTLHAAIRHAVADSPAYHGRGILVTLVLEAQADLRAETEVLYNAVYTLFCAMPHRLIPGTTLLVTTVDVPGGVELAWDCREELHVGAEGGLRDVLRQGPHGDLVDIAYSALERFCGLREGACVTERNHIPTSPQFPRAAALQRRVRAFLPVSREEGVARATMWRERATAGAGARQS